MPIRRRRPSQLNQTIDENGLTDIDGGDLRDVQVELPAGFIGNPTAVPACPSDLRVPTNKQADDGGFDPNVFCGLDSIVGIAEVTCRLGPSEAIRLAVFNLEPPPGVAARFAFGFLDVTTTLDARCAPTVTMASRSCPATRCRASRSWPPR